MRALGVRLALGHQTRELSIAETIFNVYEAKKASEVAPGVGKVTDIVILSGKAINFLTEPVFEVLSEISKERPTLEAADMKKLSQAYEETSK